MGAPGRPSRAGGIRPPRCQSMGAVPDPVSAAGGVDRVGRSYVAFHNSYAALGALGQSRAIPAGPVFQSAVPPRVVGRRAPPVLSGSADCTLDCTLAGALCCFADLRPLA